MGEMQSVCNLSQMKTALFSTLNPAIYCKYNKDFRVPFREMLACRCATLQHVMRQQSFTSRYGPTVARRNDAQPECSDL
ncbi:hypothetical protein GCK32_009247 [Trichostrongylus colubriformis]|uniref:Uncharacterized protein n=1 Tax=Trichostrongylus colubriformis TaxID=6319 RepID=A0AAN8F6R4_TRICO